MEAMAAEGLSAAAIADRLGSTPASVRTKCCELKIVLTAGRGRTKPEMKQIAFKVPYKVFAVLDERAAQLKLTPDRLARDILSVVLSDNLIDAVLG